MSDRTSAWFTTPDTWLPELEDFPAITNPNSVEEQTTAYAKQSAAGKASLLSTHFVQCFGYNDPKLSLGLWYKAYEIFVGELPNEYSNWKVDDLQKPCDKDLEGINTFLDFMNKRMTLKFSSLPADQWDDLSGYIKDAYLYVFSAAFYIFKKNSSNETDRDVLEHFAACIEEQYYDFTELTQTFEDPMIFTPSPEDTENLTKDVRISSHLPEMLELKPGLDFFPLMLEVSSKEKMNELYEGASQIGKANILASLYVSLIGFVDPLLAFGIWNAAYDIFLDYQPPTFSDWGRPAQIDEKDSLILGTTYSVVSRFYVCFNEDQHAWQELYILTWHHFELIFNAASCHSVLPVSERDYWMRGVVNNLVCYSFDELADPQHCNFVYVPSDKAKQEAKSAVTPKVSEKKKKKKTKGPKIVELRDASPERKKK